ncbi:putative mitochondrial protein, partial [Mucuna pruriens]
MGSGIFGALVSGKGVAANPKMVEAMQNWPVSKDVKAVRGFLGLTNLQKICERAYDKALN